MQEEKEKFNFIDTGKRVLDIESKAISELKNHLDEDFESACNACIQCNGKIIVMGVGKSGHIADKIAATFASTGTPSFFVSPSEALHGDLGMIDQNDIIIALSNSGESQEIIELLPVLKKMKIPIISLTGNNESKLAKASDSHINVSVKEEACPMNLAPTASTTAALAMGDAIAVALLEKKGFSEEDFAKSHPGGTLGKKLLLLVKDIMHIGDEIPYVSESDKLSTGLIEMSQKALGMTAVINDKNELTGIFTDGDLRRTLEKKVDIENTLMHQVMSKKPFVISPDQLATNAVEILQGKKITSLIVAQKNKIVGALNIHDLFRAGLM
ncbi:MAG: KpsF/GutQ family sugar-phosphate isomerase [Gammaproteobacteria bacterium]|nr:KpsF/GutQ family sugar-phosphate isomerase [Gammaproteobacteria bacterium]